jgi:ribosome-binding factor A
MTPHQDEKLKQMIRELAASFVQLESNGASIITITNVTVADRGSRAKILFTVLPVEKQAVVEEFLKRKRIDFQEFVRSKSRIMRVPLFDFAIDHGEKNRQRADELLATEYKSQI